jgi:long-chain acyl-CoA synthetase
VSTAGTPAGPEQNRSPTAARTVPGLLAARAARQPDRIAIETEGARGALTFFDWHERAAAVACGLLARGLDRGQRVVLRFGGRDWIDFAVAYCGVLAAGGVAVPCSDRLAPVELRHIMTHCGATALLFAEGKPVPRRHGGTVFEGTLAEVSVAGPGPARVPVRPGDLAQIIYTSGTTGPPKGVSASHANVTLGAATHPGRRRLAHSEHFLHAFPIGTNAAQAMLVNALDAKPTALPLPRFTPGRFARLAQARRVGSVFVVPAMAIELLSSGALDRFDLSGVLLFGSTGAALPPAVAAELARRLPAATIVNYYTSTEAAPVQLSMIFDPLRPGSVGRAAGAELRVLATSGDPVGPGEVGDVWLRSPYPRAYYRDKPASRAAFRAGWVRMGDLGRLDEEGYLYLVDRASDVIKSGGDKVSTLKVEAALYEHPGIAEAAVLGVPHPVLGMAVAAAVVPQVSGTGIALPQLRAFLLDRLASHELPAQVILADRLPRNAAGKVVKRDLLALFHRDQR